MLLIDGWHGGCLIGFTTHRECRFVKHIDMDTYSPELSKLLHESRTTQASACDAERDEDKRAQEAALVELAERISAARSIV